MENIKRACIQEAKAIIDELSSLDLKITDIDYLKDRLFLLFKGYVIQTPKLKPGQIIYRGVKWTQKPTYVTNLSYPSSSCVLKLGRVNREIQPIFYASTSIQAVFYELGLNSGDKVAVSKWKTKSQLLLNNIGYTTSNFGHLGSKRVLPSWSNNKHINDADNINELIKDFFSKEFTKKVPNGEEYLYKLSIAIAEKHFHDDLFDGLLYPSIAMNGDADNIAIKHEYVDRKMSLEMVKYIQVDKHEKELKYNVTVLDSADSFSYDGRIEWKGPPQRWIFDKEGMSLTFEVENGKWVARNTNGEIVSPI